MESRRKPNTIMFLSYTIFVLLALFSGISANDFSLLNNENSLFIKNEFFQPNLSMRKINKDEDGLQEYSVHLSGDEFSNLKTDTLVFFLNKVTDNAYSVKFNDIIIGSEGDMKNGHSMFKNSPNHFSFDRSLVKDDNLLVINTYATYKSGLESKGVYIADSNIGMRQARKLDFFGIHLVLIGIGFLLFSILIMIFIYYINQEREIAFLYCAIATFFVSIYFVDYLKIIYLSRNYLFYKKIFLIALFIAVWFYMLAMSKFFKLRYLKHLAAFNAISFIIMSLLVNDFTLYKKLYTYWFFLILINIILGFLYSLSNLKKVRQAFIFVGAFLYASIYASSAIIVEFLNFSFNINSPLVYLVVFSALPILFGFEELISKEKQIHHVKKQSEQEYINSITDNLTGAWNQRFLYNKLRENSEEIILAMIDIDNFKEINDKYGHTAGDFLLKEFTNLVLETVRKTDDVCRYGGDEFIILLNNCNENHSSMIMEKLRKRVEEHLFNFADNYMKITISIGIYKTKKDEIFEEALKKVDQELYKAKEKGKNTISIFL